MVTVCVLLADGFEEIEAVTIVDVLRRAGIETSILGVTGKEVRGAHDMTLSADGLLADAGDRPWDMVVLPGGMPGSAHLRDDAGVQALLRRQSERGGKLAAICAAPIALAAAGLLAGRQATSYPGFADQLGDVSYQETCVVVDGDIITSRGPGTSLPFALRLVEELLGAEVAQQLGGQMLADT